MSTVCAAFSALHVEEEGGDDVLFFYSRYSMCGKTLGQWIVWELGKYYSVSDLNANVGNVSTYSRVDEHRDQ